MKILYTVSTYNPHTDGIQFVTSYLAEGLVKRGHSVDLIAYEYPDLTDKKEEVINGVRVMRYPVKTVHMMHKGDKEGYQKWIIDNQKNYDVMINVGSQTALTDWLLPVMDQIKIPKVLHLHSVWDFGIHKTDFASFKIFASKMFGNLRWGGYFLKYKKAFQTYDVVLQLHNKDYAYNFFKRKYGVESRVLENAAEDDFFEIEHVKKEKVIINVSNYGRMKNQLDTIKTFEKSSLSDEWKLVFIGSKKTSYYQELENYCKNILDPAKRDSIVLHVGLKREQVKEYVKSGSIYMTNSLKEAFPISILEAMAAGVPYISSDVGIVKYLGGGIVPNTQAEFVQSLERLAADDAYRKRLGEEGRREACEKYKISKKVEQLEAILDSLTSKE